MGWGHLVWPGRVDQRGDAWFGSQAHAGVEQANTGGTNFQAERAVCAKAGRHERAWYIHGHQVAHYNWSTCSEERGTTNGT